MLQNRLPILMTYIDLQVVVALLNTVTWLVLYYCLATPNYDIVDINQMLAVFWLALRVISDGNDGLNLAKQNIWMTNDWMLWERLFYHENITILKRLLR